MEQLRQYLRNSAGNVAIMFALTLVPMLLAAGTAVDYMRASNARTELQAALDGAALAVAMASDKPMAERLQIGQDYFEKNFSGHASVAGGIKFAVAGELVTATADYDVPTSFMSLGGVKAFKLHRLSEVSVDANKKVEIALVLDYSLSMVSDNKYLRMRDAAINMINTLEAGAPAGHLKVGLVPFSGMVRTTMQASYVTQPATSGSNWTGCTQDRRYSYNIGVSTPGAAAGSKWGYIEPGVQNASPYHCANYASKSLNIIPLTDNFSSLRIQLSAMRPIGYTNIPLGTEFGWNLLDPDAPFTQGAAYTDDSTRKFLVVLTDGVQTSPQWGAGGSRSVANGNGNLVEVCSGARQKDITVFAIAYDITDPAVTDLLKQCAPGNYYEPSTSGTEIEEVFKAIAKRIKKSTMRLAR